MSIQGGTSDMSVIKGAKSYTFLSELICNKKNPGPESSPALENALKFPSEYP